MCGIFFTFTTTPGLRGQKLEDIYETCKSEIIRRGPDYNSSMLYTTDTYEFLFAASVLWLQGTTITEQPIQTHDSIFVYNGDIFGGTLILDDERRTHGDTISLLNRLENCSDILNTLLMAQGPYALIYFDKRSSKLYFARDKFGRRSLVMGRNSSAFLLSSVFPKTKDFVCVELPALGVFCMDLKHDEVCLYPWPLKHSNFETKLREVEQFLQKSIVLKNDDIGICKAFSEPSEIPFSGYNGLDSHHVFQSLLLQNYWVNKVTRLNELLEAAVKRRIGTQPHFCQNCMGGEIRCNHATTGVLFSGGIDCAILALLADKYVDKERPIDLLNVAFNLNAPDRATGKATLDELTTLCPNRTWNFVEINVEHYELSKLRSSHIKNLIYPLNSILDDSLGCALWFASRGQNQTYKSPCRVLLVGMGADELFGGYTKHRAAFKRGGWSELNRTLEDDWQNISHRNLARDDRVVSDHGRQLRTPYLDEDVVDFVRSLNCWERTCPTNDLPQGLGEKILLRSLGYHLGLVNASVLKKRALQFGSRIANSKEHANDVSPRL